MTRRVRLGGYAIERRRCGGEVSDEREGLILVFESLGHGAGDGAEVLVVLVGRGAVF